MKYICIEYFFIEYRNNKNKMKKDKGTETMELCAMYCRYAKIQIKASEPIVPFRETIVPPPTVDMVNEAIQDVASTKKVPMLPIFFFCLSLNLLFVKSNFLCYIRIQKDKEGPLTVSTPNQKCSVTIRAVPLPPDVISILENNSDLIRTYDQFVTSQQKRVDIISSMKAMTLSSSDAKDKASDNNSPDATGSLENTSGSASMSEQDEENLTALTDRTVKAIEKLKEDLKKAFDESGDIIWKNAVEKIWSCGPRRFGPNILFNNVEGLPCSFWKSDDTDEVSEEVKTLLPVENSFVNGFQLATLSGPLCDEPMMGVGFFISKWSLNTESVESELSGQVFTSLS